MGNNADRELLKSAYPKSKAWANKVDKMLDDQVAAIILRLRQQGKL